jgi:hypothetical protein
LLLLLSVIAIQVCDADIGVILEFGPKVINHNRRNYRLASSWNAWAEKSLLACVEPRLEFVRI